MEANLFYALQSAERIDPSSAYGRQLRREVEACTGEQRSSLLSMLGEREEAHRLDKRGHLPLP